MTISIFTPSHNNKYLLELYSTIKDQPFDEWVIVANSGVIIQEEILKDERVKVFRAEHIASYVGALKKFAISKCTGDILVEIDHDDLVTPDCIEEVRKAFEDTKIGFVYSNTADFKNGFEKADRYNLAMGWEYRPFVYQGHKLEECLTPEPHPYTASLIWYAPNHVRAFRKSVYDQVGGHSDQMRVLDDQDLISRFYQVTEFKHIDKCLYLYRITGSNTWITYNEEIQNNVWRLHDLYFGGMVLTWAKREGLRCLDLGGGINKPKGYESVDLQKADVTADLNEHWPFEDNSVGVLRAHDILEHLKDPIHTMNEAYRVLKHGGVFDILVPSTEGEGAFCDPTHVSFWNKRSFRYYTEKNMRVYLEPKCQCKFQVIKVEKKTLWDEKMPYIEARLVAIKNGRFHGQYDW